MRKLGIILIGLIVSMTSVVMAQPSEDGGKACPRTDETCGRRGPRHGGARSQGFFKAVGATEEQQEKLKPILKAHHEKIREQRKANREKHREAIKAMHEATTKEEFQAANKQLKALFKQRMKLHDEFQAELAKVLDESQMKKAKAYFKQQVRKHKRQRRGEGKGQGRPGKLFKGLDLTDEQKEKIRDIMTDAHNEAKKAEGPERHEIMKKAMDKIKSDVLTKDQAAKLKERFEKFRKCHGKRQHPLAGIASKEQMKQIDEIMSDARKKAKDASPEERRDIMQAAREKVANEVLNEQQRDKLNQRIKEMRKHRRGGEKGRRGKWGGPRRGGMMKDFTEDQKAAAKKIMDEAREKAKDASPEERRDIMQAAHKKIRDEVMTDEQREKMKKMRRHNPRKGRGDRGPRCGQGKCEGDDRRGPDGPPPPPDEDEE